MPDSSDGPVLNPPPPIRIGASRQDDTLPNEVEMPLVDHLEELRQRVLRSLLAVVVGALSCLLGVKPLVRLLEAPASGIHFLQLAPGEFLFVSLKVAGYAGLTLHSPRCCSSCWPRSLDDCSGTAADSTTAGSAVLFLAGIPFAWWVAPAALRAW